VRADVGWVTGHSYIVYGPSPTGHHLMFEGVPTGDAFAGLGGGRQAKVNIIYTARPRARADGRGDDYVKRASRASLKLLGTVGEPINPEAWDGYWKVVGEAAARSSIPVETRPGCG